MAQKPTGRLTEAPKYLNDFSKALASEVRILLQEVGKLRDERRALQFEIAQLMAMKSQHGPGGEFAPDWKPETPAMPPPPPPPGPPAPVEDPPQAKPGWRVIENPRKIERKKKQPKTLAPPAPPAPIEPPKPVAPSWGQWKGTDHPNPHLMPKPVVPPLAMPPKVPGLFGPRTPPPQ